MSFFLGLIFATAVIVFSLLTNRTVAGAALRLKVAQVLICRDHVTVAVNLPVAGFITYDDGVNLANDLVVEAVNMADFEIGMIGG